MSAGLISACTSGPIKVVEQSDSKPSWATLTKTVFKDGDQMKFVGYFPVNEADSRPSAAINGSATKAGAMPLVNLRRFSPPDCGY